jgi:hypothetical protein
VNNSRNRDSVLGNFLSCKCFPVTSSAVAWYSLLPTSHPDEDGDLVAPMRHPRTWLRPSLTGTSRRHPRYEDLPAGGHASKDPQRRRESSADCPAPRT